MREFKVVVLGSGGVGKSALTVQFVSGCFMEKYDPTIEDFYRKEIEVDNSPCVLEILDTAGTEQFASMRDLYIKNGQGFVVVYSLTNHQTFQDIKTMKELITRVKGTERVPILLVANKVDLEHQREYIWILPTTVMIECQLDQSRKRNRHARKVLGWCAALGLFSSCYSQAESLPTRLFTTFIARRNLTVVEVATIIKVSHSEGSSLAQQWGCPFIEASAKQRTNVNEMFAEIVREMNFTPDSEKKSYCCCILL